MNHHVVVIGLGYAGLTLALVLAKKGFRVTGVDVNAKKVKALRQDNCYVHEIGIRELLREQQGKKFDVLEQIPKDGDVFIIAVAVPLCSSTNTNEPAPNLDYLRLAAQMVGKRLSPGALVVLRSTVPVGSTRKVVLPIIEEYSALKAGLNFHLSFAPERTVEGNALQELRTLPQIIGGIDEESVKATAAFFQKLTPHIVRVESLEAAELAKLANNCFRDLVFSFSNSILELASFYNIDAVEVIRAANQNYPRNPIPMPSPGVGGPCLTKDPYILASCAKALGGGPTLMELGRQINEFMPSFIAEALKRQLKLLGKDLLHCEILICGLAFKGQPETGDTRNSSALELAKLLQGKVGKLFGHDPIVSASKIKAEGLEPVSLPNGFFGRDGIIFMNNHPLYKRVDVLALANSLKRPGIIYDGWHLFQPNDILNSCPVVYMGLGFVHSSVNQQTFSKKNAAAYV